MVSHLEFCHLGFSHFEQKKLHSFILTQLDDGSHLEFYHLGFSYFAQKHFTHTFWLILMIAAILNSAMLDSATAILDSDTLLSSLRFTQKHSHSTLTLTQTNSIWLKLIHSHLTWWWQPSWILPSWILAILDSILVFPLKITHTCQDFFHHLHKKKLHSFILTQLDDGSHLEFCHGGFRHCHLQFRHLVISLRFTQKHSHSTLTLTETNSIYSNLFILDDGSHLDFCHHEFCHLGFIHFDKIFAQKKTLLILIHSHSTW